jgi:hypothetical protein
MPHHLRNSAKRKEGSHAAIVQTSTASIWDPIPPFNVSPSNHNEVIKEKNYGRRKDAVKVHVGAIGIIRIFFGSKVHTYESEKDKESSNRAQ